MKTFTIIIATVFAVLIASCSCNRQFDEIDRSIEQLNWRLERLDESLDKAADIDESMKEYRWFITEFQENVDRLEKEIDDVKESKNDAGKFSAAEISEALNIIAKMNVDAFRTLRRANEQSVEMQGKQGSGGVVFELTKFVGEIEMYQFELKKLRKSLKKLPMDNPMPNDEEE